MSEPRTIEEWLASRPACVQALAREFPVGSKLEIHGTVMHLIGYTEADRLIVTPLNPRKDFAAAVAAQEYVCASHFRPCPIHGVSR
jgi:hypothetical protein